MARQSLGNDSARVWGDNSQAQIGDGTTTARTTPVWPIFYNAPDRLLEKFVCIQENLNYTADTVHPLPSGTYRIVVRGGVPGVVAVFRPTARILAAAVRLRIFLERQVAPP
ncbi:MAG: hypothetical protein HS122_12910 [Opitutaceae bacterium]|nr:hypothetical protein [Opitutaceae bacterium]